jgi:hypothetical protein
LCPPPLEKPPKDPPLVREPAPLPPLLRQLRYAEEASP